MALVGEAHIIVRAITTNVNRDIQQGFSGVPAMGKRAGESLGQSFTRGFNSTGTKSMFTKLAAGIRTMVPGADAARESFHGLIRTSYALGTGLASVLGGISAMVGGLGALAGSAGGAISTLVVLGNVAVAAGMAMLSAKLALGGVGKALGKFLKPSKGSAGTKGTKGSAGNSEAADRAARAAMEAFNEAKIAYARRVQEAEQSLAKVIQHNRDTLVDANNDIRNAQLSLNAALKEGREEIQQLGFDAEDAALAESKAALELDKARETLMRVQDLPPNSRVRKEAELAYQEADLNLRRAKDRSADLNKEQDRLARTGVAGTSAVISATKALADAEAAKSKEIRDGLQDEADAVQNLNEAKADVPKLRETAPPSAGTEGTEGTAGSGGDNPFEGLNQAQIDFVKFLATLKPLLDTLKLTAANALLPPLEEAIRLLADGLFPTLNKGVGIIAASLGQAAISVAKAIIETKNLANLDKLFVASGPLIESFGRIIGSVWGIVLSLLTAAIPLTERFVGFLESKAKAFDEFLKVDPEGLTTFFDTAGQIMADFGTIFGNIFGGIGAIITANFGPGTGGQLMLDWLMTATDGFSNIGKDGNMESLKETFLGLAENAISVFSSIGALLDQLGELGKDPAIGDTFDILKEGAPSIGSILEKLVSAGPAFAGVVVELVKFVDLLTDGVANSIFFDVIKTALEGLNDVLANETVNKIATVTGQVAAFMLALGFLGAKGAFVFKYIAGSVAYLSKVIGFMIGVPGKVISAFKFLWSAVTMGFGILWKIVNGFYIKMAIAKVKDMILTARIQAMYAADAAKAVARAVVTAAIWVKEIAMKGAVAVATAAMAVASGVATAAQWAFNAAMSANPISLIIIAIVALVAGLIWFFTQTELGKEVWANLTQFITDTWNNFSAWITGAFEAFLSWWGTFWSGIGTTISDIWTGITTWFSETITAFLGWATDNWGLLLSLLIGPIGLAIQWIVENWAGIVQWFSDSIAAFGVLWSEFWTAFGKFFTDLWAGFIQWVTDAWSNYITGLQAAYEALGKAWNDFWTGFGKFFSDLWDGIIKWVTDVFSNYIKTVQKIYGDFGKTWNDFWERFGKFFSDLWDRLVSGVKTLFDNFVRNILGIVDWFRDKFQTVWKLIADFFGKVFEDPIGAFKDLFSGIAGFVTGIANDVLDGIEGMVNGAIDLINGMIEKLSGVSAIVGVKLGKIPHVRIPRLAKGGTVMPSYGGTMAVIGEAGRPERVEPLDPDGLSKRDKAMIHLLSGGSNGMIVNVYPSAGMDEAELAAKVSREITFQMRRGAVA